VPDTATLANSAAAAKPSSCCAVIAVKHRAICKTRLADVLTPEQRLKLVRSMLNSVIAAAIGARTIGTVVVVSPEQNDLPPEIRVFRDKGLGLNAALNMSFEALRQIGFREVLVLPADLPRITSLDIDAVVVAARRSGFSIAPDAKDLGSNALCTTEEGPFRFQFGANSKLRHLREAHRLGLVAEVIRRPGLAFDVDTPSDLSNLDSCYWT
jgi:2-phospho-L-lactate guanylyltransferase